MAQGSRTTFAKRQKEQARKEKQRAKAEKRQQKKEGPGGGPPIEGMDIDGFDGPLDGPILPDWAVDDVPNPETDKQK